jgi:hypothetical protein
MRAVNDYSSTTTGAINDSATTVTVSSATGLPTEGDFFLAIDEEIILVTHRSGTTLTVLRGQDDTSAAAHSSGATIDGIVCAGYFEKAANERRGCLALPYGKITRWDGTSFSHLTASDFTAYNTGTGTLIDDGNDGTIIFDAVDMAGNYMTLAARTFSTSSDWRIVAHIGMTAFEPTFDGFGFLARDATALTVKSMECRPKIFIDYRERASLTNTPTSIVSTGCGGAREMWVKLEIEWNTSGSDDTFRWYNSRDGVHWFLMSTATFAANDQQVGLGITNITGSYILRGHIFRWHEEALTF